MQDKMREHFFLEKKLVFGKNAADDVDQLAESSDPTLLRDSFTTIPQICALGHTIAKSTNLRGTNLAPFMADFLFVEKKKRSLLSWSVNFKSIFTSNERFTRRLIYLLPRKKF